jgi:hypothetical protein
LDKALLKERHPLMKEGTLPIYVKPHEAFSLLSNLKNGFSFRRLARMHSYLEELRSSILAKREDQPHSGTKNSTIPLDTKAHPLQYSRPKATNSTCHE